MIVLFLLIIPSFVLVGIDRNYFTSKSAVVARVDGHDITQDDWDNAHRMETDRIRAQSPSVDARLLDSPRARYATLERLVRDRVMQAAAVKMHLVTSDAQLARTLQGIPAIAALKRPDGSLDAEAYRALVGSQGLTPEGFESNVRRELSLSQVMGGVLGSAFAGQGAGAPRAGRALPAPRDPGRPFRRQGLRRQGRAHRRRTAVLLQGPRSAVPPARACGRAVRGARPGRRARQHHAERGRPAQLLQGKPGAPRRQGKSAAPATS